MKYLFNTIALFILLSTGAYALRINPPIAPLVPPDAPSANEIDPYPSRPATNEYKVPTEDVGLFSLHQNAELSGFYMLNRSDELGLLGIMGGMVNFCFQDPWYLGNKLGLAEDAVEFKAGSGLVLGLDVDNRPYFSIPAQAEATVYLKEGSFFDMDPFVGAGINMNILGTDWQIGGIGIKFYCGVLRELWGNKLALSIGYGGYQINNARNIEGIYFQVSKPVRL